MDLKHPKPRASLVPMVIFAVFVVLCSLPTVRSEQDSTLIRLPTESESESDPGDEPCPGSTSRAPAVCPVNCFRPDPVCGVDGVTYWCGCPDAECAGVQVAKVGFCEVGSGGSAPQALLLVHLLWLIVLGVSVLFGLF